MTRKDKIILAIIGDVLILLASIWMIAQTNVIVSVIGWVIASAVVLAETYAIVFLKRLG